MAIVVLVVLAATGGAARELCLSGAPCRDFVCGTAIEPSPELRTYTLTTAGSNRYDFGVVDSGAATISCKSNATVDLQFDLPALARGAVIRLAIKDEQHSWTLRLGDRELKKGVQLSGPAGTYEFRFESAGYVALTKAIELAAPGKKARIRLEHLPILTGRVIDRATGTPVAGAMIVADSKTGRAVANATGQFAITLDPAEWPKILTISAGGFADFLFIAPPARTSGAVGDISISRGGTVAVSLQQEAPAIVLSLQLYRTLQGGRTLGPLVRTLQPDRESTSATLKFENVEPGEYLVMAAGHAEWERFGEPVIVTAAQESRLTMTIVPFELRFQTRAAGRPLPGSYIRLRHRDMLWQGLFSTDDEGEVDVTLWQGGRLNATVERAGSVPYIERKNIDPAVDTQWILEPPSLEVTGTVVDALSGQPIANAGLALDMTSINGYQLNVSTKADDHGVFRFAPVTYGEHKLAAAARGYAITEQSYTFQEPETQHNVTIRLESAPPIHVIVTDTRANPIAGARVLQFNGLTQRSMAITDSAGAFVITIPAGEQRDLFVVPRDGSLAFFRLMSTAKETSLLIPDGSSRVVLRAVDEDGNAIPNVAVVMRYNGIVLPFEVIAALASRQGLQPVSNAHGEIVFDHMPAGVYEFWPVASVAELREVAAGAGPSAPVRVAAAPGENVAVMTFEHTAKP